MSQARKTVAPIEKLTIPKRYRISKTMEDPEVERVIQRGLEQFPAAGKRRDLARSV